MPQQKQQKKLLLNELYLFRHKLLFSHVQKFDYRRIAKRKDV